MHPRTHARTASCGPRLFTLSGCVNRWLWSDSTHRRLGVLAFGAALTAYASGLLGWRALPPLVARCCAGLVALIGASTLGGHGVRESGRALRAAALPPARLVRGVWRGGVPCEGD